MAKNHETDSKTTNRSMIQSSGKNARDSQNCGTNSSKYSSRNSSKSKTSGSYDQDSSYDRY